MDGRDSPASFLFFILLLGGFAAGLTTLFSLRFQTGDIFPVYSSLRSDPLGVKALYEALGRIPGVSVRRNHHPLARLATDRKQTLFYLGARTGFLTGMPCEVFERMHLLARSGTRIVISFLPEVPRLPDGVPHGGYAVACGKTSSLDSAEAGGEPGDGGLDSAASGWKVSPGYLLPQELKKDGILCALPVRPDYGPADGIPVHSALYFEGYGPEWSALYAYNHKPVIMERSLGSGSIVLVADSYLLSNEALRNDRYPEVLARLLGGSREVVFDEHHLGIPASPGLMTLARHYRLYPLLFSLLLVGGLFVWQSGVPFVPFEASRPGKEEGRAKAGRDQLSGLINLLRRNIAVKDILGVCFEEWRKNAARPDGRMEDKARRIRELIETGSDRPAGRLEVVTVYRKIVGILSERADI